MDSFLKLLLGEFGNSIGVPVLPFDDAGNCTVVFETTSISLIVMADSRVLTLSSCLDSVVDERRAEQALTETMNIFRRHGFCLVIEPGAGLMLRCRLLSEGLTLPVLSEIVSQFIAVAEWIGTSSEPGGPAPEIRSDADDYMQHFGVRA